MFYETISCLHDIHHPETPKQPKDMLQPLIPLQVMVLFPIAAINGYEGCTSHISVAKPDSVLALWPKITPQGEIIGRCTSMKTRTTAPAICGLAEVAKIFILYK